MNNKLNKLFDNWKWQLDDLSKRAGISVFLALSALYCSIWKTNYVLLYKYID